MGMNGSLDRQVISVSGKGGTGKTTFVALLLKTLVSSENSYTTLVVDADPDTNLPDVLGVKVNSTVGKKATELKRRIEEGSLSFSISKSDLLEAWVYETLVEHEKFDLLIMGRTEGEGCYCYVNNALTNILDRLITNYDIVLMDMEAGLEHLSRRTDRDVNTMIVVCDPSKMSLKTAIRIRDIAREVHINIRNIYLVGNRFHPDNVELFNEWAEREGFKVAGYIPEDPYVQKCHMMGIPLMEIPEESPALSAVKNIAVNIGIPI
jgi:CO dehydrogenase maturation factor